jgi:hypothetical protein
MQTTDTTSRSHTCDKGSSPAAVGQEVHDEDMKPSEGGISLSLFEAVAHDMLLSFFAFMLGVFAAIWILLGILK